MYVLLCVLVVSTFPSAISRTAATDRSIGRMQASGGGAVPTIGEDRHLSNPYLLTVRDRLPVSLVAILPTLSLSRIPVFFLESYKVYYRVHKRL
jgi:hypothetical protein